MLLLIIHGTCASTLNGFADSFTSNFLLEVSYINNFYSVKLQLGLVPETVTDFLGLSHMFTMTNSRTSEMVDYQKCTARPVQQYANCAVCSCHVIAVKLICYFSVDPATRPHNRIKLSFDPKGINQRWPKARTET